MLSSISITQLLIILAIVIMIFGTKRFRQAGGDLGAMFSGIRKGFSGDDTPSLTDIAKDVRETADEVKSAAEELKPRKDYQDW